jgi:signal transduction histidine kinase
MHWILYLRLIALTAGTLLPFFWIVVILGHRRQRNFERIFFFLCLALTCFCGSSLLALNSELYYGVPPQGLLVFAWIFLCLGFWSLPALVVHLHVEYASLRELIPGHRSKLLWVAAAYLPALILLPNLAKALQLRQGFRFQAPSYVLGEYFQAWLFCAILVAIYWQSQFRSATPDQAQRKLHQGLILNFVLLAAALLFLFLLESAFGPSRYSSFADLVILCGIVAPLVALMREVGRFNFLQIGRQRNLIYAVFAIFVALLYLSFVRRASLWLEPHLPPEATAALLLFLPVVFFEPLQRLIRRLLQQTAQTEVDRAHKLMGPINEAARLGDLEKLRQFAERWIAEQLQLAEARLSLDSVNASPKLGEMQRRGPRESFEIRQSGRHLGTMEVRAPGAMISGETYAALEFLCEQLPGAFDLCRLIEEKLQLERELAERERLALVGQMAASISHNLKNPLGSIKTILQVQMENPEMPASLREETQMVLDEVRRLSDKLNQLLQFSRPGLRNGGERGRCDLARVAETVVGVFRHDAEQRGVALSLTLERSSLEVSASAEATNDILSNLVLNALEAAPSGGHVCMVVAAADGTCCVSVEDDGAGIQPALQEKILQPFFTTKSRGTGLGLAIVVRRVEEIGGKLDVESPIRNERGSRFVVTLPLKTVAKETQS